MDDRVDEEIQLTPEEASNGLRPCCLRCRTTTLRRDRPRRGQKGLDEELALCDAQALARSHTSDDLVLADSRHGERIRHAGGVASRCFDRSNAR